MRCLAFDTAKALDLKRAEMHSLVINSMFQSKLLLTLDDDDELMLNVLRCHLTY